MQLWKPLLIIVPAGLALGMVGGQLARPIMTERAGDDPAQAMFQTRSDRYGTDAGYAAQGEASVAYDGGYSYAPSWAERTSADWPGPDVPAWAYADVPLPTVAELDARQAALLADPEVEFAATPPEPAEPEPAAAQVAMAPPSPADIGPEPRTADGQRAIW